MKIWEKITSRTENFKTLQFISLSYSNSFFFWDTVVIAELKWRKSVLGFKNYQRLYIKTSKRVIIYLITL